MFSKWVKFRLLPRNYIFCKPTLLVRHRSNRSFEPLIIYLRNSSTIFSIDLQLLLPLPNSFWYNHVVNVNNVFVDYFLLSNYATTSTWAWWLLYHTVIILILRFAVSDSSWPSDGSTNPGNNLYFATLSRKMDNNGLEDIFVEVWTLTCPKKHPPCMTHILVSPEGSALW